MSSRLPRIGIVTTMREPLAHTLRWANYYRNGGIEHLFIYLDDPGDAALPILRRDPRVTCTACDDTYWADCDAEILRSIQKRQMRNADHAMALARERGLDWLIHLDADELLHPVAKLAEALGGSCADVVNFDQLEAVPEVVATDDPFGDMTLFRALGTRRRRLWAQRLLARRTFFGGEWFRAYTNSKSAVRVAARIDRMGLHMPFRDGARAHAGETIDAVQLLHYDCAGFTAWREKWRRRSSDPPAVWSKRTEKRRLQSALFGAAQQRGEAALLGLYRRVYFVPRRHRPTLRALGLLRRVQIDQTLFDAPPGQQAASTDTTAAP